MTRRCHLLLVVVCTLRAPFAVAQHQERIAVGAGHALALGGQYRVVTEGSNFEFHPRSIGRLQNDGGFAGYRLRTWLNLHDSDKERYGAYVQIELGGFAWSQERDVSKDLDFELRRAYVWFKPTESSLLRAGVLDWHDAFGERRSSSDPMWAVDAYDASRAPLANSVWNFSTVGVTFDFEPAVEWHVGTGAMLLQRGDRGPEGDSGTWLFTGDVDRDFGSRAQIGFSTYYLHDDGGYSYRERLGESWDVWAGMRAHFALGRFRPSIFAIVNRGRVPLADWEHQGYAFKAALDVDLFGGTLSGQGLYSTGNHGSEIGVSGEFRTVAQSAGDGFGAQSYWSLGGLSSPRGPSDLNDLGVGLQNRGLGLETLQAAYARRLTRTLSAYGAFVALYSEAPRPLNESRDMGRELLVELQWTLSGPLGLDVGAARFWTDDFYRARNGGSPQDLYQVYFRVQLEL